MTTKHRPYWQKPGTYAGGVPMGRAEAAAKLREFHRKHLVYRQRDNGRYIYVLTTGGPQDAGRIAMAKPRFSAQDLRDCAETVRAFDAKFPDFDWSKAPSPSFRSIEEEVNKEVREIVRGGASNG